MYTHWWESRSLLLLTPLLCVPSIPLSPSIHPSLHQPWDPSVLSLSCFLSICDPHWECSSVSRGPKQSNRSPRSPPTPTCLPQLGRPALPSPTARVWAAPSVYFLHRLPAVDHVWVSAWNIQSHLDAFLQCRSGEITVLLYCMEQHILHRSSTTALSFSVDT